MNCRLLYFIGRLRDGGAERQLYYLLRDMDARRYRPEVVVWNLRETDKYVSQLRALSIPIHGFGDCRSRALKMKRARKLVRQIQPEVVHSYSFYTNLGAWYASFGTGALVIGSVRSEFSRAKRESGALLGRLSARLPRQQIVNSRAAAESIRGSLGPFVPRGVTVVRNGVDLERFQSTPMPALSTAIILGIGTFSPVKRWDRLIRVAARLKASGQKFIVRLVGDGPLRKTLEEQAKALCVRDCIELNTRTDDIPALLSQSTILAHTSDSEGCPNVVMEAMACGRPVVATDAGDISSLVDNGRTGFVVRRGDDHAFAERIALLLKDRELCEVLGGAGRSKAEEEFSLSRLSTNTLNAYREIGWRDA